MIFTINGIIRGGKNHIGITRTGRRYPLKNWAKWRDQVVAELWRQALGEKILDKPCHFIANYWKGDRRKRDVPAMLDSLYHCFERAGVVKDDSLFEGVTWVPRGYDKINPRVVVEIRLMGEN